MFCFYCKWRLRDRSYRLYRYCLCLIFCILDKNSGKLEMSSCIICRRKQQSQYYGRNRWEYDLSV